MSIWDFYFLSLMRDNPFHNELGVCHNKASGINMLIIS